jgi:threonyl-tRNA synthetase
MKTSNGVKAQNPKQLQLEPIRHSLAHLLAAAVLEKFPKAKLGIGPTIEDGFYYDFKLPAAISDEDLKGIEKTMRTLISRKLDFNGKKVTPLKAKKLFKDQPFKLELIKEFVKEKKSLTVYETGDIFMDLCRGGHVKNTSEINSDAFKLTKVAGAYWRGDEKNPMLTRIYGAAFETKKELEAHLNMIEEAKKRDHKKLGPELDLFTFSDLVGSGLPLWTPKGTILRDVLDNFVWELRKKHGYERVDIPHITKKELYETSGHWEKFENELFRIKTREGHMFALKPMNCPHHTQIYARKQWSYRELPQRYASTTKVYRDEQTGELSGLSRVRAITQDDAHVFCRKADIANEILKIWDIAEEFYSACGFPELEIHLSFHNPKEAKKYLGSPAIWKEMEQVLSDLAKKRLGSAFNEQVKIDIGEAAFYGPKIDFITKDSLGRNLQVATIQLDMNMPRRFNLTCVDKKGEKEQIFMIHAAIMGSIERFLAAFIEHTAGKFPFRFSPVQVAVLPISEKVKDYAETVIGGLKEKNIRVELDDRNETIGKKIREAELQKIPYLLVIGEREADAKTAAVRKRGEGDLGAMTLSSFFDMITKDLN